MLLVAWPPSASLNLTDTVKTAIAAKSEGKKAENSPGIEANGNKHLKMNDIQYFCEISLIAEMGESKYIAK